MEIIDIHPHIIADDPLRYPSNPVRGKHSVWSQERPQTFEQLVAEMDAAGVAKAAIVQASTNYGTDNSYVADSAMRDPVRFAGVGTIDLVADDAIEVLEEWRGRGISGIRIFTGGASHNPDNSLLADPRSFKVWDHAGRIGMTIAVQVNPTGLNDIRMLADRFPETRLVIDHAGRPVLEDGPPYAAAQSLFDLAQFPNLYVKITPRTFALARSGKSTPEAFFPALVAAFGSNRIAYGSNLPANEGPMTALIAEALEGLASLEEADRAMIMGGTAKVLYPSLA